jgi:hypothetical protein
MINIRDKFKYSIPVVTGYSIDLYSGNDSNANIKTDELEQIIVHLIEPLTYTKTNSIEVYNISLAVLKKCDVDITDSKVVDDIDLTKTILYKLIDNLSLNGLIMQSTNDILVTELDRFDTKRDYFANGVFAEFKVSQPVIYNC